MAHRQTWTPERDRLLREMFRKGLEYRAISERLDVSETTIFRRLARLGLRRYDARDSTGPTLSPKDRYRRPKMGSLADELPVSVQRALVDYAVRNEVTIAGAVAAFIAGAL